MGNDEKKVPTAIHSQNSDQNMSGDEEQTQINSEVSSMHIKLQPFWMNNPRDWFNMAEIIFDIEKIKSDKKKYVSVLSALSPQASHKISDLLAAPPSINCYETIKQAFLDRLAPSAERKLTELLSGQDMGDMRPTEILRHIRVLAENQLNDSVIKQLWLRKLPEIIKIAIVAQPESITLERLAKTADNMNEHIASSNSVASISDQTTASRTREYRPPLSTQNTFETRLARLETKIDNLLNNRRGRSMSRSPSRVGLRNFSSSRSVNRKRYSMCWYHYKYGKDAKRCHKPCNFGTPAANSFTNKMEYDQNPKNPPTTG